MVDYLVSVIIQQKIISIKVMSFRIVDKFKSCSPTPSFLALSFIHTLEIIENNSSEVVSKKIMCFCISINAKVEDLSSKAFSFTND